MYRGQQTLSITNDMHSWPNTSRNTKILIFYKKVIVRQFIFYPHKKNFFCQFHQSPCAEGTRTTKILNKMKCTEPLAVQVAGVVEEPDSVDERSQLTRVIHRTFVISSQVLRHLLPDTIQQLHGPLTANIFTNVNLNELLSKTTNLL